MEELEGKVTWLLTLYWHFPGCSSMPNCRQTTIAALPPEHHFLEPLVSSLQALPTKLSLLDYTLTLSAMCWYTLPKAEVNRTTSINVHLKYWLGIRTYNLAQ